MKRLYTSKPNELLNKFNELEDLIIKQMETNSKLKKELMKQQNEFGQGIEVLQARLDNALEIYKKFEKELNNDQKGIEVLEKCNYEMINSYVTAMINDIYTEVDQNKAPRVGENKSSYLKSLTAELEKKEKYVDELVEKMEKIEAKDKEKLKYLVAAQKDKNRVAHFRNQREKEKYSRALNRTGEENSEG